MDKKKPNTIVIEHKKYVLLPWTEYQLLVAGAPSMPEPLPNGNYPVTAGGAVIARGLVRDRLAVGLTQKQLAEAAGIRPEVLNRAERGITMPTTKTMTRIDNALVQAGLKRKPAQPKAASA